MSIKPIFDCLLCCEEKLVMKKISNDTLKKYSDYQFKPFIAQFQPLSSLELTPIITAEIVPKAKVKHWSYLKTREMLEIEQTYHDIERSIIRKEKPKIEFEDIVHDIYDPDFSSEEEPENLSNNSREHTSMPIPTVPSSKVLKKPKKKQITKTKASLQAFVKTLKKIK
jgi:hypothetical protein